MLDTIDKGQLGKEHVHYIQSINATSWDDHKPGTGPGNIFSLVGAV